ncbi:MAG TPA: DNA methyltransferase [Ktedonobacteraceae bacterium]|nr:DNA methyltransferase [Ktedonobacteraceae bacterium]
MLYHADALDVIKSLVDSSIDLLLTDPPYGFDYRSRSHKLPLVKIRNDRFEAIPLLRQALRLMYPKLKENATGLVFTNWQCYSSMEAVIREEGYEIKNVLIWKKNAWSRGDLKGNWGYKYEMAFFFRKKSLLPSLRRFLNGKREGNILEFKKLPTNGMSHPTEKPVELLQYLIEKTTQPGEVILDPFCGSGSSGVASLASNRICVLAELEKIWANVASQKTGLPVSYLQT